MKEELYKRILETDLKYVKCFSDCYEEEKVINLKDSKLRDMYMHNFSFFKKLVKKDELINFIEKKLQEAEKEHIKYVHIMMDDEMATYDLMSIFPDIEITEYCVMTIKPEIFNKLKINKDCVVLKADTKERFRDGISADIQANKAAMGEFVNKRIMRKQEVYQSIPDLNFYVCYKGNEPIGKCEFFIKDGIGKIEDFDIIEEYQRQGYGTSVVQKLLNDAYCANVNIVYLITDNSDTAKEMYQKCGFSIKGIKTSLLFTLYE